MKHCDTLIAPRWCIPVRPAGAVLEGHALAIGDGRIMDLLPREEAARKYQPSSVLERPSHALIPGFVNAHTHAAMTLLRGFCDDLPLERWLREGIWPAERRWVSAEMVRDGTELAVAEMLLGGTTCFSDQYFFPEVVAETADRLHVRANVGTPVIDFPTPWAGSPQECLEKGTDLVHDAFVDHPLVTTCFAPHSTGTVTDVTFRELRVLADQLDLRIQIHLHESAAEIEASLRDTGMRPFERLERLGLVNASLLAVHAVHVTQREVDTMAAAGVAVAHCPKSNLKLASGIASLPEFLKAGINVGVGTDSAASNNSLDMLEEMRVAALLSKVSAGDAASVPAREALEIATLGAAAAIGLGDAIGSLEPGKWADITCVDLAAGNTQPVYDPVSQLVYAARAGQVSDVWVAGRQQVDAGELTHIDVASILERSNEWRQRIASREPEQQ
jgi:5-methylthioadenosine/S-adenosylhomocysteine deaminase